MTSSASQQLQSRPVMTGHQFLTTTRPSNQVDAQLVQLDCGAADPIPPTARLATDPVHWAVQQKIERLETSL